MSVVTRDVSDVDVFVECQVPASIPLYRLVHFQIERRRATCTDLPAVLQQGKVLSAVYRVGPVSSRRPARRRDTRCGCWSSRRHGCRVAEARSLASPTSANRRRGRSSAESDPRLAGAFRPPAVFLQYRASPSHSSSNGAAARYAATCASVIVPPQLPCCRSLREPPALLLVRPRLRRAAARTIAAIVVEVLEQRLQVRPRVVDRPEVRQEHRRAATTPRCARRCPATASMSMSGGGVGGSTYPPSMQTPAVSPTNATPLDRSK